MTNDVMGMFFGVTPLPKPIKPEDAMIEARERGEFQRDDSYTHVAVEGRLFNETVVTCHMCGVSHRSRATYAPRHTSTCAIGAAEELLLEKWRLVNAARKETR